MADEGRLLVDTAYLQKYLVDFGNEKMEANWARTARLHHLFKDQLLSQQVKMGAVGSPYTVSICCYYFVAVVTVTKHRPWLLLQHCDYIEGPFCTLLERSNNVITVAGVVIAVMV